jgi:hypothetical protein
MTSERCPDCGRYMGSRKVGIGSPARWICLRCFDRAMAQIGDDLRRLMRKLEETDDA